MASRSTWTVCLSTVDATHPAIHRPSTLTDRHLSAAKNLSRKSSQENLPAFTTPNKHPPRDLSSTIEAKRSTLNSTAAASLTQSSTPKPVAARIVASNHDDPQLASQSVLLPSSRGVSFGFTNVKEEDLVSERSVPHPSSTSLSPVTRLHQKPQPPPSYSPQPLPLHLTTSTPPTRLPQTTIKEEVLLPNSYREVVYSGGPILFQPNARSSAQALYYPLPIISTITTTTISREGSVDHLSRPREVLESHQLQPVTRMPVLKETIIYPGRLVHESSTHTIRHQ